MTVAEKRDWHTTLFYVLCTALITTGRDKPEEAFRDGQLEPIGRDHGPGRTKPCKANVDSSLLSPNHIGLLPSRMEHILTLARYISNHFSDLDSSRWEAQVTTTSSKVEAPRIAIQVTTSVPTPKAGFTFAVLHIEYSMVFATRRREKMMLALFLTTELMW